LRLRKTKIKKELLLLVPLARFQEFDGILPVKEERFPALGAGELLLGMFSDVKVSRSALV
jgi:hypothetical protein